MSPYIFTSEDKQNMKIAIAQQNYHIGNFASNTKKIINAIRDARANEADLIVFSELAVCGYPPYDLLEHNDFINQALDAIELIKAETDHIAVLIGAPSRNQQLHGKSLFNSAYFIYGRTVNQVIHKMLLPNYDIFDEYRYFEPAVESNVVEFKGKKLAITICEDIWNVGDRSLYKMQPMDILTLQSPDMMINLSASPFDYMHAGERLKIIRENVKRYRLPVIYCNAVGGQTDILFDGGSTVCDVDGAIVEQMPYFEEAQAYIEWQDEKLSVVKGKQTDIPAIICSERKEVFDPGREIDTIYEALVFGIKEYFSKMGFQKAIIASSGGIDSAVTLALACRALGPENVYALLMPSQFSTGHSVSDAEQLSKNLNNPYEKIAIRKIFHHVELALKPAFGDLPFNVAEENIQSRIRGLLAMALSNKFDYILLNTSNKSELATGYGTLYGDMAGGLSVLGDVYKTQVYALAKYINRNEEVIPEHIITKPPSAELRPGQLDQDSLPEYDILDAILYQYIERRQDALQIVNIGHEQELVKRVVNLLHKSEYKRKQFCPILRISPKSFGRGRQIPIVSLYTEF